MLYAVKDTRSGTVSNWHSDREGTQRACNNANFRHNRILERCGQPPESPFVVVERNAIDKATGGAAQAAPLHR